ncbi:S-layer homology domain-containing protein [Candidatus Peregrinibacteria bacterium]|nr:S-layer homology domain-containing protein [Candidatus Peregrinibacteria bacterium]
MRHTGQNRTSKIIIATLFFLQTILSVPITSAHISTNPFLDLPDAHPNTSAILYLKDHYIIAGYPNGTFQPDKTVNRAEALKLILLGANYHLTNEFAEKEATENAEIRYNDVSEADWYFPYVAKATRLEIVQGYADGYFRPENTVNRAETLKMIIEANGATAEVQPENQPFNDVAVDSWYASYAQFFKSYHLIAGDSQGNLNAGEEITRGEISQLIYGYIMREKFLADGPPATEKEFVYGKATYYGGGDGFNGRGTASGEIFDDTLFTAAHRTLPFDTWLRVYSTEDETKYVDVRINDRGPYDDRFILDLSAAAFQVFAPLSRGIIDIKYERIEP